LDLALEELVGVEPFARHKDNTASPAFVVFAAILALEGQTHGFLLDIASQVDVLVADGEGHGGSEHTDCPRVDANEEDTIVEPVPVLVANEMDVRQIRRGQEDRKRNVRVQNEGISISPPAHESVFQVSQIMGK